MNGQSGASPTQLTDLQQAPSDGPTTPTASRQIAPRKISAHDLDGHYCGMCCILPVCNFFTLSATGPDSYEAHGSVCLPSPLCLLPLPIAFNNKYERVAGSNRFTRKASFWANQWVPDDEPLNPNPRTVYDTWTWRNSCCAIVSVDQVSVLVDCKVIPRWRGSSVSASPPAPTSPEAEIVERESPAKLPAKKIKPGRMIKVEPISPETDDEKKVERSAAGLTNGSKRVPSTKKGKSARGEEGVIAEIPGKPEKQK